MVILVRNEARPHSGVSRGHVASRTLGFFLAEEKRPPNMPPAEASFSSFSSPAAASAGEGAVRVSAPPPHYRSRYIWRFCASDLVQNLTEKPKALVFLAVLRLRVLRKDPRQRQWGKEIAVGHRCRAPHTPPPAPTDAKPRSHVVAAKNK